MSGTICQSCGMPLSKDPNGGGQELDGTKSLLYCSKCYVSGAFTDPDMTVGQMRQLVKGKLQEMGMPGFLTGLLTYNIPKLKRWAH
jgi:hypothetical protein